MAISLKHSFTNPKADSGDTTIVRPSDWNAEHTLTQATSTILGRVTAGTGATEELSASQVRTLINVADGADVTSATNVGTSINGSTAKTTPVDADVVAILDSAASNVLKKLTFANLWAWVQSKFAGASSKTTPIDADSFNIVDSAASNVAARVTGTNLKAYLKTYNDTLYQSLDADLTSWAGVTRASGFDTFVATPSSDNFRSLVTGETGTGGGVVFATGPTITNLALVGAATEDVYTITDAAGFAIDPTNGSIQQVTLGASRTPTQANWTSGQSVLLKVADGTAYTITWSTISVTWVGGTAPTLATTGWTLISLWKDGSTIYGKHIGDVA